MLSSLTRGRATAVVSCCFLAQTKPSLTTHVPLSCVPATTYQMAASCVQPGQQDAGLMLRLKRAVAPQTRYMLGDNGAHSYVVGFGKEFPTYVQSMGASCPGTPSHPLVRRLTLIPTLTSCPSSLQLIAAPSCLAAGCMSAEVPDKSGPSR